MAQQVIITVGREFGSGGHEIADRLSKKFQMKLYDRNLIDEMAQAYGYNGETMGKYDEKPINLIFSKNIKGHTNSVEKHVALSQFDYLKSRAEKGESFVVVGRCAEFILKDYPTIISLFILGDQLVKQRRVQQIYNLSESEALAKMKKHDKSRKSYHNYFAQGKWGDSRTYDLTINSSRLGIEGTVEFLADYIEKRLKSL